jgi:hypothetical protein
MGAWASEELERIGNSDDLHISPFREDGVTYGTPTWIWSVVVNGELYVRAYHGVSSRWYRAAMQQRKGRITAAGISKEVSFEPVDHLVDEEITKEIDEAYRAKYRSSPYLKPMIGERARAATVRIMSLAS